MGIQIFYVGLGGAIGAMARVWLMRLLPMHLLTLPIGIMMVNILGCLIIGMLTEVFALYWNPSLAVKHLLIQGILGGFTTFSAFALEFGLLYKGGRPFLAVFYVVASVCLSIAFFFLGAKSIRLLG